MIKGYRKNQIVVVTKSIGGNIKGTITKVVSNSKKNNISMIPALSILCEASTDCYGNIDKKINYTLNRPKYYNNIKVWEEIYIRPATTNEKRARRKGIYLPKRRKTFDELSLGDTIMMQYNQRFIELKIDAIHYIHNNKGIEVIDVGVKPINLKKEFKSILTKDYFFLTEDQLIMSSAPIIY